MTEPIIIALSGRKGAGKNTLAQFIRDYYVEIKTSTWRQETRTAPALIQPVLQEVYECSFADSLKDFCIDTLGLERNQCYGSEDEKNTPTQYSWNTAEPYLSWKFGTREVWDENTQSWAVKEELTRREYYTGIIKAAGHRMGPMSGREVMQLFGTELVRETFGNVWAQATIRRIKKSGARLAIISDNRFPNESEVVLNNPQGFIIRLTRNPYGQNDLHPSEVSLDDFDWNRSRCFVLDNANMSLDEQKRAARPILDQIFVKEQTDE